MVFYSDKLDKNFRILHECMIPELTQNIFLERVGAVVILGLGSIVGSTIGKHPFHIGNKETFVTVVV